MGKREAIAADELGMAVTTARSKLVKMLLFRELQRSGNDNCFRCKVKISDIDHLSIEHKQPWLHIDPELFWDLDNVEFSHTVCNRPHTYVNVAKRKIGPEGTSWCFRCQKFLPVVKFNRNSTLWNGLARQCKSCHHYWRVSGKTRTLPAKEAGA